MAEHLVERRRPERRPRLAARRVSLPTRMPLPRHSSGEPRLNFTNVPKGSQARGGRRIACRGVCRRHGGGGILTGVSTLPPLPQEAPAMSAAVIETHLPSVPCRRGKVRDVYDLGDRLLLVSTDRISAFDWVL